MARRNSTIPTDQHARLKQLYADQRAALAALADADNAVTTAQTNLANAQQAVQDAQANATAAYHALVNLIGAAAAETLTGRRPPTTRHTTPRKQHNHDKTTATNGAPEHADTAA